MKILYDTLITYDDYGAIQDAIKKRLVTERFHKNKDFAIYNYTRNCQYERIWNNTTLQCRGLILDHKNKSVVARPFSKFFNLDEIKEFAPDIYPKSEPIDIFEKYDGSLGIMYLNGDTIEIATRGSFYSDQSEWANNTIRNMRKDKDIIESLDEYTHLFEIVYPESKVVVNYNFQGLVYLGSVHKDTGEIMCAKMMSLFRELFDSYGIIISLKHPPFADVSKHRDNKEGYVLRFENNLLVKVKHEEYVKLHRILRGLTPKNILEMLRDGIDDKEILEDLDEENLKWYEDMKYDIIKIYDNYSDYYWKIASDLKNKLLCKEFETKKDLALYVNSRFANPDKAVIFAMVNEKDDVKKLLWRITEQQLKDDLDEDINLSPIDN